MKRKIVWVVVSGLMVLSLVMASCGPGVVEEKEVVTKEEVEKEVEKEVVAPTVEKPKYGGVLRVFRESDIADFDDVIGKPTGAVTQQITNEPPWSGDWTRGPAGGYGTYETDWANKLDIWEHKAGYLAESWELPNKIEGEFATIIYHIRQGVHWALNPDSEASRLVGGRELTADDVVFSLKQVITIPSAYIYQNNPNLRDAKITALDKWTVKIEFSWDEFEEGVSRFSDYISIVPPEVVAKYGSMRDWKVSVGTGPFMLTDVVPGSSATLVRNPNYWMKDPIGPGKGNQLPYLDGVKYLIIVDRSTLLAALRTGKLDLLADEDLVLSIEDVETVVKSAPQVKFYRIQPANAKNAIALKVNNPPFNDIRVRRALFMAIDFEAIKNDYFGGEAEIVTFPITRFKEYADAYYGLDEPDCPESIKEVYTYNPEKAKQLLAEAGYPQGFKTNLILSSKADIVDYYSILKAMWAKVGVDVELRPKETAAFSTIRNNHNFDGMLAGSNTNSAQLYKFRYYYGVGVSNLSEINDPVVNETFPKVQNALVTSRAEANRLHKELMKYVLDQCWHIPKVTPLNYSVWWPWVKNYSGEVAVGYQHRHAYNWIWIDQELKKSMGY